MSADDQLPARYSRALAAAAANPQQQVVRQPTETIMVLYFKKHLQRHMTATGLAGTEHMSLIVGMLGAGSAVHGLHTERSRPCGMCDGGATAGGRAR